MAQSRYLYVIGSSNSRRIFQPNIAHLAKLSGCETQIKAATTFSAGREGVRSLKGDDIAIISFLTNTLVEECDALQPAEIEDKIKVILREYIEVIKSIPETVTIVSMYPYPRVQPAWVFEWINWIHNQLDVSFETMGSNLHRIPYTPVTREDFETDCVHRKQAVALNQYRQFAANYARIFSVENQLEIVNDLSSECEMVSAPNETQNSDIQNDSIRLGGGQWGDESATP